MKMEAETDNVQVTSKRQLLVGFPLSAQCQIQLKLSHATFRHQPQWASMSALRPVQTVLALELAGSSLHPL